MPPTSSEPRYSEQDHPGRRRSDRGEYCPKCHNLIRPGHMPDHNYHVHGEDRRQSDQDKTPPPPEKTERRKTTQSKDDGGEQKPQRKDSRWFAGRPQ